MPKTSLIFTLLLTLCLNIFGTTKYFSEYENYNDDIKLNNHYIYKKDFNKSDYFIFKGAFAQQKNDIFKRKSLNNKLFWKYNINKFATNFSLISEYQFNGDKGKPDKKYYEISSETKSFGINLNKSFFNKISANSHIIYLRQNKSNSAYDYDLNNTGYNFINDFAFNNHSNNNKVTISGQYKFKRIKLSDYTNNNLFFDWKYKFGNNSIHPKLNYINTKSSLYDYDKKNDTQLFIKKNGLFNYNYHLDLIKLLSFSTIYSTKINNYKIKNSKNYFEKEISYHCRIKLPIYKNILTFGFDRNFDNKFYSHNQNTLKSDFRNFLSALKISISDRDSIIVSTEISLKRNNYPDENNSMDYDLQKRNIKLLINYYPNDYINIKNTFMQNISHQVYLFSSMSGNSNKKVIFTIIPRISILLNNFFSIEQEYHLRADYDRYDWIISGNDRYFRKFSAEYSFIYNTKPLVFVKKNVWNRIKFKNINSNFFDLKFIYKYDTNNSGEKTVDNKYKSLATNKTQTCTIDFNKNFEKISYRIRPKISWSKKRELNQLFSLAYQFNDKNKAEFLLNPLYLLHEKTIWKIFLQLNYSF